MEKHARNAPNIIYMYVNLYRAIATMYSFLINHSMGGDKATDIVCRS